MARALCFAVVQPSVRPVLARAPCVIAVVFSAWSS